MDSLGCTVELAARQAALGQLEELEELAETDCTEETVCQAVANQVADQEATCLTVVQELGRNREA